MDGCGVAHDGEETLFRIVQAQPDVVLLDLIMPKTDGLSVLERLSREELAVRPHVIVASAVGQEGFTRAALERGADYYMIKPFDLTDLLSRVCMVAARPKAAAQAAPPLSPRREEGSVPAITRAVMELGLPAHMKGCQYVITGVRMLLRENRPCSIVKEVYAGLAAEYGTTTECVEGAIRKAIRHAWERPDSPLRTSMGGGESAPPSNGRFLTTLAQHLRLEQTGKGEGTA